MPEFNTISTLETIGSILTLWCIYLAAKNNILSWPISIIATGIYFYIFYTIHLFSDAYLQIAFIFFQLFGWWEWSPNNKSQKKSKITKIDTSTKRKLTIITVLIFILWLTIYKKINTNSKLPELDTLTTVLSLVACFMEAKRWYENWIVWIIADLIYIPLYIKADRPITAVLYSVIVIIAVYGLKEWKRIYDQQ